MRFLAAVRAASPTLYWLLVLVATAVLPPGAGLLHAMANVQFHPTTGNVLFTPSGVAMDPACCCGPPECYPCGTLPGTVDVELSGITLTTGCWEGDVGTWHKWLGGASLNQTITLTWDAGEVAFIGTIAASLGYYIDATECAADNPFTTGTDQIVRLGCDEMTGEWGLIITEGDTILFAASASGDDVDCGDGTLVMATTGPTAASSGGSALVTF